MTNEYDEHEQFYKLLDAEHKLRSLSDSYTNGYFITIFACCRELYDHNIMCDGLSKEFAKSARKLKRVSSMSPTKVESQNSLRKFK